MAHDPLPPPELEPGDIPDGPQVVRREPSSLRSAREGRSSRSRASTSARARCSSFERATHTPARSSRRSLAWASPSSCRLGTRLE